jgi:hypothetical protein
VWALRPRAQRPVCKKVRRGPGALRYADGMSERNGDRARFQKNRKRKLRHRQRVHALVVTLRKRAEGVSSRAASRAASVDMLDEGGPLRRGD